MYHSFMTRKCHLMLYGNSEKGFRCSCANKLYLQNYQVCLCACPGATDEGVSDWLPAPAPGVCGKLNNSIFMKTDDRQKAAIFITDG